VDDASSTGVLRLVASQPLRSYQFCIGRLAVVSYANQSGIRTTSRTVDVSRASESVAQRQTRKKGTIDGRARIAIAKAERLRFITATSAISARSDRITSGYAAYPRVIPVSRIDTSTREQ